VFVTGLLAIVNYLIIVGLYAEKLYNVHTAQF